MKKETESEKAVETQNVSTVDSLSELRMKVAELCGWTLVICNPGRILGEHDNFACAMPVPDYPRDLNACHAFEEWLLATKGEQAFRIYVDFLVAEMKPGEFTVSAKAYSRCSAFVNTMESLAAMGAKP